MGLLNSAGPLFTYATEEGSRYFIQLEFSVGLGAGDDIQRLFYNGSELTIETTISSNGTHWLVGGPYVGALGGARDDDEVVVIIETRWPPVVLAQVAAAAVVSPTAVEPNVQSELLTAELEVPLSSDSVTSTESAPAKRKGSGSKNSSKKSK